MKLSTKGRYAVTAMMDLALREHTGPITLANISHDQGISNSYLEQLFARLRKHGLVKGVRGPRGGYRLARPAQEITVADIISAVDESVDNTRCRGKENCQDGERCLTHELWMELSASLFDFLNAITLAQYIERPAVRDIAERYQAIANEQPILEQNRSSLEEA